MQRLLLQLIDFLLVFFCVIFTHTHLHNMQLKIALLVKQPIHRLATHKQIVYARPALQHLAVFY
jgi:hypothetical protein